MNLDHRIEERLEEAKKRLEIAQLQMQAEAEIRHRDRRERIATAAMQGVMASGLVNKVDYADLAKLSILIADALIEELDKPKEVKP